MPQPSQMNGESMSETLWRLEQAAKQFRRNTALAPTDLTIHAGARIGIVGESGSGKTTLVKLLARLAKPSSGRVIYRGTDITQLGESGLRRLRSEVQFVFQDPRSALNPRMKVADIITEPLRSLRGVPGVPEDHDRRLREVLDAVELPSGIGDRYPGAFSGGQRQRIAIARALAPRPQTLIADEPVSALDMSIRGQVLGLIAGLADSEDMTLICVSHDLFTLRTIASDLLVMRSGEIVDTGPVESIYRNPTHPYTSKLIAAIPRLPSV